MNGLVVKNTGSWYQVCIDTGETINCKIKGSFRLKEIKTTNPIAVGDRVSIELNKEGTALIYAIEERRNYIIRRSSNLSKQAHILAANLDQALLIVTLAHPVTSTIFIDRFLASAEAYHIPVKIVFNKVDLLTVDDREYLDGLIHLYETIGYPCLQVSALRKEGMDAVRQLLHSKVSLLSGHSGVGKSSIINLLVPELNAKVGVISEYHKKGMHTTTFSEMVPLPEGGYLIDTPGIKGFGTIDLRSEEVAHYFPDLFRFADKCRFYNCTHRHEPGCAVLEAVEKHQISQSRYQSYLNIMSDSNDEKYR